MKTREIETKRLIELLDYNEESGIFIWKKRTSNRIKVGDVAGRVNNNGYIRISIDGIRHLAHRLAWLYIHGEQASDEIDHINHIRSDNRIVNLREVDRTTNGRNMSKGVDNTSGTVGVHFYTTKKRWIARITVDQELIQLGCFASYSDAVDARKNAEVLYGFHGNHGK